jgi:hypothetical protein
MHVIRISDSDAQINTAGDLTPDAHLAKASQAST